MNDGNSLKGEKGTHEIGDRSAIPSQSLAGWTALLDIPVGWITIGTYDRED